MHQCCGYRCDCVPGHPENISADIDVAVCVHGHAFGLPDAEKAVSLQPKQAAFLETRAEIYEKLGRRADAIADYRAALAVDTSLKLADDGLKRLDIAR